MFLDVIDGLKLHIVSRTWLRFVLYINYPSWFSHFYSRESFCHFFLEKSKVFPRNNLMKNINDRMFYFTWHSVFWLSLKIILPIWRDLQDYSYKSDVQDLDQIMIVILKIIIDLKSLKLIKRVVNLQAKMVNLEWLI